MVLVYNTGEIYKNTLFSSLITVVYKPVDLAASKHAKIGTKDLFGRFVLGCKVDLLARGAGEPTGGGAKLGSQGGW